MRLAHLHVENFRSIERLNLDFPRICALIGPNNSGKSNILEAVRRVLGRDLLTAGDFEESDVFAHDPERDLRISLTLDPPIAFRRFKEADPVPIEALEFGLTRYKIGPDKGRRRLEQKCLDPMGRLPSVLKKAPKKGKQHEYEALVGVPAAVRDEVPLIHIGTRRSLSEHLPGARHSLLRQLFEDIEIDLQNPANVISVQESDAKRAVPRQQRFRELMGDVVEVLRTDQFVALERSIKMNALRFLGFQETDADKLNLSFSPFDSFQFYKALDLQIKEGPISISATESGGGVQNALVLAILRAFEERRKRGAILLIEEPEMFLHPQMQRSLYRTLREIGATNQVIYTTHSPHFVTVPYYEEAVLVRKNVGATVVRRSNLPTNERRREKLIKELDPERSELFFATKLLLVEGDTEKLAIPQYAQRAAVELDRIGATIVEVGGKRNLLEMANIAMSFGIPLGIVYDEDSSDFKDKREDEQQFNADLERLATANDGGVRVWRLSKNYEDELRRAIGEAAYQRFCQTFPYGKPTRARLIAADATAPPPVFVGQVLDWIRS